MSEKTLTPDQQKEMTRWVRGALAHLYDTAFLQTHPLGEALDSDRHLDTVTRAQHLRRVLLDCVESLRPQGADSALGGAARAYAILGYHYIDGFSIEEIAAKLSLSRRQAYREHEKGIEAIASLLNDRLANKPSTPLPTPSAQLREAHAEVSRLRQNVRIEVFDVEDVLTSVCDMLRPLADQSGVRFNLSISDHLSKVAADRVMLRQVLLNILTHLLDVAQSDVSIRLSSVEKTVHIDMRTMTSEAEPNTAMVGIEVAHALSEAQGGQWITEWEDGEWRVHLSLLTTAKPAVLVIDDNADLVELFRRYLGGHDVAVIGAPSSEEAVRLCAELQPQVVMLDVMMPGVDGWDVLQQLKRQPETKQIPVVVCSVLNESKLATAMGASGYLTKPVNQADFLLTARRWLGSLMAAG